LGTKTVDLVTAIRKLKKLATGSASGESAPERIVGTTKNTSGTRPDFSVIRSAYKQAARALNVALDEVAERIETLLGEEKQLHEQLTQLASGNSVDVDQLLASAELVGGTRMIVCDVPHANAAMMRQWVDQIRKKSTDPVAVLFANASDGKVTLIAGISNTLVEKGLSAGKWIGPVASEVGGSGGGKPDLAQAGGKAPEKIADALRVAKETWRSMLG
ncbi:MAG: alanine--tRNA ligase, partial [Planctomycetes bacterium]|nr:alanine--tRNA ligase [Planctomycetota bacterium]